MHLHGLQFPQTLIKEYTHDIFGWSETNGTYHEGLVDCYDSQSFYTNLAELKLKWDKLEGDAFVYCKSHKPDFHEWFKRYKADDICQSTLRSLREDVGLGSPPSAFYTNDSESINALLKESLNYKKHQWGIFNEKVKKIAQKQQSEMEKAVIGYGEYQLRPQYSFLAVPEEKWFRMSQEQRQQCITKFNSCTVRASEPVCASGIKTSSDMPVATQSCSTTSESPVQPANVTIGRFSLEAYKKALLSVSLEHAVSDTMLPYTTIEGIWYVSGRRQFYCICTWFWSERQDGEVQVWICPSLGVYYRWIPLQM